MSLDTSKKVLKVTGIISIIFGIIGIIAGIMSLVGGHIIGSSADFAPTKDEAVAAAASGSIIFVIGGALIIAAIITLLEGWLAVRASKDTSKIMPAFVFSVLGVIGSAFSLIADLMNKVEGSTIVGAIIGLGISVLILVAANTIRKSRNGM